MSSKTIDLDKIAKRLNENYPQCRITETDGRLVIELPISKIEVNGFHVAVSVLDEAFDEVDCENTDELYEVIEKFILVLREDEKYCNPTFARANKNAAKYFRMLLYAAAALLAVMIIVCSVFDLSMVYLLIGVIVPWLAVIPMRFICGNSFKRDWVCPHCGASLPMEEKKIIPCAKLVKDSEDQEVLSWNEEDRTPLHDHLKAIRAGLAVVMVLFAAGAIMPILLYIYTDIKLSCEIYLACFSSLPMILYYLVFAPVLTPDYPEGATEEWKAMHVRFPVSCQGIISLLVAGSVYYFWESAILQIADTGRFMLLAAAVSGVLMALFYFRTPKRLRKEDGLGLIILSLFLVAISLTYGLNMAISEPARHYPAVVVEQNESESEDNGAKTLTLLLDDGKEMELNTSDKVYALVNAGVEFVVCQKENFLGIRMVRLHLPEGTDVSRLLNPNQNGETQ